MKWLSVCLFVCPWAFAQISFNAALTSDYVWRGVSQTDEDPALQLGVDWAHESGFYLGGWASNVDFGDGTDVEFDAWLGFKNELDSGFSYDLGYIYYFYEGDTAQEYGEAYLALGYKIVGVKYSRDLENDNGYLELNLDQSFAEVWSAGAHYGDYDFDGVDGYNDWLVYLARAFGTWEARVAFSDTDLDGIEIAEGRVFGSISKSW